MGAMGSLQAWLARTAVLPLMVHDEKLTVPPETATPPPCKHKRETCENPIGAMGNSQKVSVARTHCS